MSDENTFRYDKMVEGALRGVVKTALEEVIEKGLIDEHHFYITFRTDHPGVDIPDYLKDRYPGEMTIVLQHQFYDLEVDTKQFSVMLKFSNVPERLKIPLTAITIFTDPSVNFALQFQPLSEEDGDDDPDYADNEIDFEEEDAPANKKGEVVSLDQFRAKETPKKTKKKTTKKKPSPKKKKSDKKDSDKDKDKDD